MTIRPEVLNILCCPQTHQKMRLAEPETLKALNDRISAGSVKTVDGRAVASILDSGLIREDGGVLYPVREGVPVLLITEGIVLER